MKISEFLYENFQFFLVVKFSVYSNWRVFVMLCTTFAVFKIIIIIIKQNKTKQIYENGFDASFLMTINPNGSHHSFLFSF